MLLRRVRLGRHDGIDYFTLQRIRSELLVGGFHGKVVHKVPHDFLENGAKPPGSSSKLEGPFGNLLKRVLAYAETDSVFLQEGGLLGDNGVNGLGQNPNQTVFAERIHVRDNRESADELRDKPESAKVLR